jgi:late competence protein required for DNA uptake (superfamily II DNA/RNA helicase)
MEFPSYLQDISLTSCALLYVAHCMVLKRYSNGKTSNTPWKKSTTQTHGIAVWPFPVTTNQAHWSKGVNKYFDSLQQYCILNLNDQKQL